VHALASSCAHIEGSDAGDVAPGADDLDAIVGAGFKCKLPGANFGS
jgi:hypothetical protein